MISPTADSRPNVAEAGAVQMVPSAPPVQPLLLANLLNDLSTVTGLLAHEVAQGHILDAFLLACGASQITEDTLHDGELSLRRVERYVRRVVPGPAGFAAAGAIRATDAIGWKARSLPWAERSVVAWQRRVAGLVEALAGALVSPDSAPDLDELTRMADVLVKSFSSLPARARQSVIRLPSSFRNFDQHPDDIVALTEGFSARWPERSRALVVVGVRTSGSYTGPLHAAGLRAKGYADVSLLTYRPGQRWRPDELHTLARVRDAGGLALVTDDPPKSGGSLLKGARELQARGFVEDAIVLLVQTLEATTVPKPLRPYPSVVLEWRDWSIQARLDPEAVRISLAALLGPSVEVVSAERRPLLARSSVRSHERALYRVTVRQKSASGEETVDVYAKGVGLGYLGAHAQAVSTAVDGWAPGMLGLREGLFYRRWLPDSSRISSLEAGDAADLVDYSLARAAGLGVSEDISLRLLDRGAVWQRAGDILARVFGRGGQFSRPLAYPLAKALLRTQAPSVIDGRMEQDRWFVADSGRLQKTDFDESGFSSLDIHCYDPVFDLAATGDAELGQAVRTAYGERTGKAIEPERWLLYRLVHIAEQLRDAGKSDAGVERASARELQRYYAATVFSDLEVPEHGALCAIDVDWTLETPGLGFPGITPAGAVALRALSRHGFRPVLATGRSLDELRERCEAYRLAGGVAEYGAWIYEQRTGEACRLLSAEDDAALGRLRDVLAATTGVEIDATYQGAVRAYAFAPDGSRRGLTSEAARRALEAARVAGQVRAIPGACQTDFMVNSIDKGIALEALADQLGVVAVGGAKPLALAVGDSAEDLPMFPLARRAIAPGGAALSRHSKGVQFVRGSGARAVAEAAELLIGHRPGACADCRVGHLSPQSQVLLDFLAIQDARGLGRVAHSVRVGAAIRKAP